MKRPTMLALAGAILANTRPALREKLVAFRKEQAGKVLAERVG